VTVAVVKTVNAGAILSVVFTGVAKTLVVYTNTSSFGGAAVVGAARISAVLGISHGLLLKLKIFTGLELSCSQAAVFTEMTIVTRASAVTTTVTVLATGVRADTYVTCFPGPSCFALADAIAVTDTVSGAHQCSITDVSRRAFDHLAVRAEVLISAHTLSLKAVTAAVTVVAADFFFAVFASEPTDTIFISRITMAGVVHAETARITVKITTG